MNSKIIPSKFVISWECCIYLSLSMKSCVFYFQSLFLICTNLQYAALPDVSSAPCYLYWDSAELFLRPSDDLVSQGTELTSLSTLDQNLSQLCFTTSKLQSVSGIASNHHRRKTQMLDSIVGCLWTPFYLEPCISVKNCFT